METTMIQELQEARMIRKLSQIEGKSVTDLAQRFFSHLLALAIVYYEDAKAGQDYVSDIMAFPHFNLFKPNSPDLYNLIVLVLRQYDYADKIFNNWDIKIPEMRMRRILRGLAAGHPPDNDFHGFMIIFQRKIPELRSLQIQIRRQVSNYNKLSDNEKAAICRRLIIDMRETGAQSDMWHLLRKVASKRGYL